MAFVIPNYHWWEGPFYGIGMKVYDQLAGELGLEKSRWLSLEETVARIPTIEQKDLAGGVIYYDGQFDDARLAVTLARTAANARRRGAELCRLRGPEEGEWQDHRRAREGRGDGRGVRDPRACRGECHRRLRG